MKPMGPIFGYTKSKERTKDAENLKKNTQFAKQVIEAF